MPKIAASMILALRDSRSGGRDATSGTVIQGFPDLEEKKISSWSSHCKYRKTIKEMNTMTKYSVFYFLVLFDQSFLNLHVWGGGL